MKHRRYFQLLFLGLLVAVPIFGVETAFWQVGSFEEFQQGTLTNLSLSKEGELMLAPQAEAVFSPEEALALSLAQDKSGNLYVGTGHQGKVFRVDRDGKASVLFTADEPDIFALAVGPDGNLYVGSSPEGKIYKVTPAGKSSVFYDPKAKYIWALLYDSQGHLYVGTGDKGQILRVDASGKGEVFFDSRQTHIMCLALDRDGNILAGSDPNGLIYRVTPQGKAFVLYQASLPEIHDLATDSRGHIYAAALGGPSGKGMPGMITAPTPSTPVQGGVTTVTVTASTEESGKDAQTPPRASPTTPSFNRSTPFALPMTALNIPQGKGALIEISPDHAIETLWSSDKEGIFGLAVRGDQVLFSTDSDGRIFQLNSKDNGENLTLLAETHESLASRLLLEGSDLYVATSNIAKVFRISSKPAREGTYQAPVKDTKFVSKWGVIAWRCNSPATSSMEFYTRAGNSERPDNTWSDWAGPYKDSDGSRITSPPARYIQWKVVLRGAGGNGPTLDNVTVSYLNQNLPPDIKSLSVSSAGERTGPTGGSSSTTSPSGTSITVSSVSALNLSSSSSSSSPSGTRTTMPVTLFWQAEDPNGDQLVYSVYVRASDEKDWHLLKEDIHQTSCTIDPDSLADGNYVAKLVASDQESNPPGMARKSELLSTPFWVDNTPPIVRVLKQSANGTDAQVHFQVQDSISPLRGAATKLDAEGWENALSDDGIVDSSTETFTLRLSNLKPGEHILSLRATDTAGNIGIGKALIEIESASPGRR